MSYIYKAETVCKNIGISNTSKALVRVPNIYKKKKRIENEKYNKSKGSRKFIDVWFVSEEGKKYIESKSRKNNYTFSENKEHLCLYLLKQLFENIETQYSIGSYYVDFYIKKYNLCIEYDEYESHKYSTKKDFIRQNNIESKGFILLRVRENHEFEDLLLIKNTIESMGYKV